MLAKNAALVYAYTTKTNIYYAVKVVRPAKDAIATQIVKLTCDIKKLIKRDYKDIIYCCFKKAYELLAAQLDYTYYYAGIANNKYAIVLAE